MRNKKQKTGNKKQKKATKNKKRQQINGLPREKDFTVWV